jgi:hypothetical protein
MDQEGPEEEQDRPRPRVVDKRVSARGAGPPPPPSPSSEAAPPEPSPADAGAHEPPRPAPPRPAEAPGPPQAPGAEAAPGSAGRVWTPEQEEEARRLAEEIARVPSQDWVISAAMNLVNVAGVKLERGEAAEAQLAIDALAGIVESVGSRLGDVEPTFRQLLAHLQMAYAEAVASPPQTP